MEHRNGIAPQFLKLIIITLCGSENMDNNIPEIQEQPSALYGALVVVR